MERQKENIKEACLLKLARGWKLKKQRGKGLEAKEGTRKEEKQARQDV
uniref:Uncharacterized protein n=1 Tax=Meloidogyne hapla TaxID=6305 RepID=A0A1I8BPZ6_MELHA